MQKFSIGESVSQGWKIFKSNAGLLIGVLLISGIISYTPTAIDNMNKNGQLQAGFVASLLMLVFWLLSQLVELGATLINIKLVEGKKATLGDLFSCKSVFFQGLIGSLLFGVIVVVGIILLVIPGIWLALRLQFFRYLIVDKKMDPFAALSGSWRMTKGNVWNLLGLSVVLILINILGAAALLVGLLVTIPLSSVAVAYTYRKLSVHLQAK